MIIVTGRSGSGKDSVVRELVKLGYKTICEHTTRPKREGEVEGKDYYFVTEKRFSLLAQRGAFVEWEKYKTVHGDWCYGTSLGELLSALIFAPKSVLILPPPRVKNLFKNYFRPPLGELIELPLVIHICSSAEERKNRLLLRGDDPEEISRRMEEDAIDFADVESITDKIFFNNEGSDVSEIAKEIDAYVTAELEKSKQGGHDMGAKEVKVYLSGNRDPANIWRRTATEMLKLVAENSGTKISIEDPVEFSSYEDMKSDKMLSMNRLEQSSVVLVNLDSSDLSARTGQECERARTKGIPIVGFGSAGSHSWIANVDCGVVFESMHGAVNYISDCFFS